MNDDEIRKLEIRRLALHQATTLGVAVCARHPYEEDVVTATTVVEAAQVFEDYLLKEKNDANADSP